jgi:hypothetical protein
MSEKQEYKDYRAAKFSGRFAGKVAALFETIQQRKSLEDKEKEIRSEVKEDMAEKGEKAVLCNGIRVTYVDSCSTNISKQKLLEAGVSVAVIERATVRTPYSTIQVKREGDKES